MASSTIALDSQQIALELYALLRDLDPARWRDDLEQVARQRLDTIEQRLRSLVEQTWPEGPFQSLQERMAELLELLHRYAPSPDGAAARDAWMEFRAHAQPAYEALAACLRDQGTHVPSLRPTNYTRNVFHVLNAVWVLLLVQLVLVPHGLLLTVALAGAVWAWSMEIGRRWSPGINRFLMSVFSRVAHPHEAHRVNSATWYATALVVLATFFEVRAGVVGLAILGLGDPLAAIVGRRFGSIRLIHGRSLQGTLAFVVAGTAAGVLAMQLWYPAPLGQMVALSAVAATVGAVAELLAKRIDDNLAIPVVSAAGFTAAAWLLGGAA